MASKDFEALIEAAGKDEALADALRKSGSLEGLVEVGRQQGYSFSAGEARAALEAATAGGELGERELDAVAGGAKARQTYLTYELKNVLISSY